MEVPNECVEQGSYSFTTNLPIVDASYHVIYQRCCRNNTISNLDDPGSQGATYSIEITPDAQQICNKSPVFDDFPPIAICVGQDINYSHAATDPEGHNLIYKFCTPFKGGGLGGSPGVPGNVAACNGVSPNPACPPPYGSVDFTFPTYSPSTPMAGNPIISIHPTTGLISGIPEVLGQFVVGVCVEEYDNGMLLSTVRRDFQFNVTSCTPLVNASMEADEILDGPVYVINSCGDDLVLLNNTSIDRSNIEEFYWEFDTDSDGNLEQFDHWDPSIEFAGLGSYEGVLVLNPGLECNDTADVIVNIFPGLEADFTFSYDTCIAGPVTFKDLSTSGSGTITDWNWDFGEGATSTEQNPEHLYLIPGEHPVTLSIKDINGCLTQTTKTITYFPVPAVVIVEPSDFIGCLPADVRFNNLSTPIDETYDIKWDFGDGGTSDEISPTHSYTEEGVFDISIEITSPLGCFASESWDNWIRMLPSPIADFSWSPEELTIFENIVDFKDESTDAVAWDWYFDSFGNSKDQNPTFVFQDTGVHEIIQIVTHESGCQDTMIQLIDVLPEVRYFLPNAFTPNYDGFK